MIAAGPLTAPHNALICSEVAVRRQSPARRFGSRLLVHAAVAGGHTRRALL